MISERQVKKRIDEIIKNQKHILDVKRATVDINAPVALLQVAAKSQLKALFFVLGRARPKFLCDSL